METDHLFSKKKASSTSTTNLENRRSSHQTKSPSDVSGIHCSDLHLSLKAPVYRSNEPDWLEAQGRVLDQLQELVDRYDAPLVYAGDIFDRPDNPAELVNFALKRVPFGHAVPGQHDLLHHNYADRRKTSYWTLVEAGKIVNLEYGVPQPAGAMVLHGFPWGFQHYSIQSAHSLALEVAVVHAYCWYNDASYKDAPKEQCMLDRAKLLEGYDAVIIGDNHKFFQMNKYMNCGTLLRRKRDEADHQPCVGLLMSDGKWQRHLLDTSKDVYCEVEEEKIQEPVNVELFIKGLRALEKAPCYDYLQAVVQYMDAEATVPDVRQMVLSYLGQKKR